MSSKRTILLIDYDPQSIQKTRAPLQRAGYRVEVAGDGVSGLEAFDKLGPDLVLIEPMVPKKHGFQVCQQIKATARGKRTPVLITTSFYKGRKHRLEAQQKYGCDGYLEKPIAEDLLLSTCQQFLIDLPPQASAQPEDPEPEAPEPAATADASSVVSFPDLPLGEDRQRVPLAALDDLSDDEIQARLDRMILEDVPTPPAPPFEAPAAATAPTPAQARSEVPARVEPAPPSSRPPAPPTASAPPPPAPKAASDAPLPLAQASEAAPTRQPARARPAVLDRPRVRSEEPSPERPSSRLPMWIGIGAVVCLLVGAALLWLLPGNAGSPVDAGRPAADLRPERKPDAPAPLPEPAETAEAEAPSAELPAVPPPTSEPVQAPAIALPAPAAPPKPVDTAQPARVEPRAPSSLPRPSAIPSPQAKPAAPVETEPAPEPAAGEAGTEAVAETLELPPAPTPEPVEASPPPALGPSEGDLLPLSDVDVAPRPSRKNPPDYPRAARELRQEGTVVLRVLVSETGAVEQVEVDSGTNFRQLRDEAVRAARGWRYEPALEQGVRVKVWITEQVTFEL